MNASLWQLAGWTMIHSLWLGAAVALVGGSLRLACRRATPNTRYAISLATLALLAAAPIAAAAWLSVNGVPAIETSSLPLPLGEGWGEGQMPVHALHPPSFQAATPNAQNHPAPGRMPGLSGTVIDLAQATPAELDALAVQQQSPQAPLANTPAPLPLPPSPLHLYSPDHRSPITSHLLRLIPYLPTLWLIGAPLTFTLLATGLVGSELLRRRATPLTTGPAFDACQRLRQTLTVTRRVALAVCDDVAQPILVGIVRPLILLPTAGLAGWTPEQLDMVLLHELAHVRRWDNLVNLLQRIVESLLFFHPAVWLVSRQVRRDREECCDAAVIRHTDRPEAYATLLIDIASRLRLSGQLSPAQSLTVASAMASHPLAGRIRRILKLEAEPMRITRRTLAATLLLPLLLAGAIFYSGASAEDSPPSKGAEQPSTVASDDRAQGGSPREAIRGGIQDANESTSLNNAKEPAEASARAKLIDDKLKEVDPAIRRVYPIPPGTLVDPIELAKALTSRRPVEIDWAEHQQGIILSAPQDVHERVAALIKKSAAKTPKFTDDTFKPIMAHNLVDSDNAPLVGGYGILEEFPADADPSTIDAAIERLKAEKRNFSVEQSDNGSKRIVDQTPPPKKPTTKKPPTIEDNSSPYKQLRDLFTATDANPAVTVKYPVPPGVGKYVEDMFDGMENDPYGPQISFHRVWSDDQRTVEVTAPTMAHGLYLDTVFNALSLESNVRQRENARNPESPANATPIEISQLQNEIRSLEDLIAKAQQELVDLEVFKELSAQSGRGRSTGLEEAIADDLAQDPTINTYKSQLVELNATLQTELSESKNLNTPELKRLRTVIQQTEAQMGKYQAEASRALREKYAHIPKNAKLAAEREYQSRRRSAAETLVNHQQALSAAKTKLAQLTGEAIPDSPNQGAAATRSKDEAPVSEGPPFDNMKEFTVTFPPGSYSEDDYNRIRKSLETERKFTVVSRPFASLDLSAGKLPSLTLFVHDHWNPKAVWETDRDGKITLRIVNDASSPGSPNQDAAAATGSDVNDTTPIDLKHRQKKTTKFILNPEAAASIKSQIAANAEWLGLERYEWAVDDSWVNVTGDDDKLKKFAQYVDQFDPFRKSTDDVARNVVDGPHPGASDPFDAAAKRTEADSAGGHDSPNRGDGPWPVKEYPVAAPPSPSPFPTLENQKIADRAYKLLGLELEPLTPEELERVKKLGYNGGLRVAAFDPHKKNGIGLDALLVGLHVWPITDLQSLDAVLTRKDLDDLSPLRFRAVVKASDSPLKQPEDRIISGRMPIDAEAFRSIQRNLPSNRTNAAVPPGDLSAYTRPEVDAASAVAEYPKAFAKALEQSRQAGKPVIVHFLAHNSEPSQRFVDEILANEQAVKFINEHFIPVTVYADDEPAFAEAFQISRVPVDMFVFAGGDCTYGGITTPATPTDYLAHLKTYHKLATTPEGQYPTPTPYIPEVAPAPVADRPSDEKTRVESENARLRMEGLKLLKDFPADVNPDELKAFEEKHRKEGYEVLVQRVPETGAFRVAVGTKVKVVPYHVEQHTFLYDGKTFDQWRDLWKLELNPERRIEAINALAAFSRTGHGQEAADAILEVAGEYGDDYSRGSPEGKLLEAIHLAVSRMPASQWMPQVQQRIAAAGPDQELWIRHARSFLGATRDSSEEARQLAAKFAEIAGDELLTATALYLWRNDQDYAQPQTIEVMRRALQQDPPGIDIAFLGFRHLDKVPEQLDVLLRSGHARRRLEEHAEKDKGLSARLSPALLEVLQNPDRANDHVGALRALRALATARRSLETTEDRLNISKELIEQLRTAPDELLPAALVTGAKLSGFADNEAALKSLQEQGLLTPERIEHLRNLDEQSLFEEANAE